ncbi:chemotaxis protein, partial [bacterium]|nr:chemotaxis protein [bacterium]
MATLIILGALTAAFFVFNVIILLRDAGQDAKYLELAGDLRVLSHQVSTSSREATAGSETAFNDLKRARDTFERKYNLLTQGNSDLSGVGDLLSPQTNALGKVWTRVRGNADTIVSNQEKILFLHDVAKTLNESIPELQQEYNTVVEILLESRAPADQIVIAQKQTLLGERIARNVDKMLEGGAGAQSAADQFNLDASIFGGVLDGLLKGDKTLGISRVRDSEARASLQEISQLFEFVSSSVDDIFKASPDLLSARQAANGILNDSPAVLNQTNLLAEGIRNLSSRRPLNPETAMLAGVVILGLLAWIGLLMFRNTERRLGEQRTANERNQTAMQRLLREIGDLGDGDLTAQSTVSENFTGSMADWMNFIIELVRECVASVSDTTV